jgi:predicted ATPase/DNA-binding CsgD family transcriptional regulator
LAEIAKFTMDSRLLTLVGPAGAGKTRLATQTAANLAPRFPGGVWFVDLSPLPAADSVAGVASVMNAISAALEVGTKSGTASTLDSLINRLRPLEALIILDNCEHVAYTTARLAEILLRACADLHLLATSRQPLAGSGEHVLRVQPMALEEAAALFADRARIRSGFQMTDTALITVREICRRLDGLPLAIELAAVRTQMLTPTQILERLEDAFRLLSDAGGSLPERQQTLQAAVEWSYKLLEPVERRLFDRLSLLSGGFDLEAAEAVGDGNVLDALGALIDKSLVYTDSSSDASSMRYRILEVLRQFGEARLASSGELEPTQERHAKHFLESAQDGDRGLRLRQLARWLPLIRADLDNSRAALRWARSQPTDFGLRLAVALSRYWELAGPLEEGSSWLESAIVTGTTDRELLAVALYRAGRLRYPQGDYDRAWTLVQQSLAIKRELGDEAGIARRLAFLAAVAGAKGDDTTALSLAEECLALRVAVGEANAIAWAQVVIGWIGIHTGDSKTTEKMFTEALSNHRRTQDPVGLVYCLAGIAVLQLEAGDIRAARVSVGELLEHVAKNWSGWTEDPPGPWVCLLLAAAEGRYRAAVRFSGVLARLQRHGKYMNEALRLRFQPVVDDARARLRPEVVARLTAEGAGLTEAQLLAEALSEPAESTGTLSRREMEIAELVSGGLSNQEIADRLFISRRTAESHVDHIKDKLGFRNRSQIVAWAVLQKLGTKE